MKNNRIINIAVMCILLSCADNEHLPEQKKMDTLKSNKINSIDTLEKVKAVETDTVKYEFKYQFSNDTITQTIFIARDEINKKSQIGKKIKFKLILNDKYNEKIEKKIEGEAILFSSTESFFDKNNPDEGDYFAADYLCNIKECELIIRLDIDKYEACVISATCSNMKNFIKNYPDYDVMKKVD